MNRPLQWKQELTPGMPFVHHLAETPLGVVRIDLRAAPVPDHLAQRSRRIASRQLRQRQAPR
jgi:hypothetical protein